MKHSVILLSTAVILSLVSCRAKKNQATTSSAASTSSTTTTATTLNTAPVSTGPKSSSEADNTAVTTTLSNPKSVTATETSASDLPRNTNSKTATETDNTTLSNSNPKQSVQAETSAISTNTTTPRGGIQKDNDALKQPTVYQGVTDQSCAVEVSFGSYGSGIDGAAMDKVTSLIDQKKIASTSKMIGREGERRLCMPLTELNTADKKDFIEQLKKIAAAGQLVSVSIR